MNIKKLEEIIFKPASNLMKKTGEEVFKRGLVSGIRGRKIENFYHIYGDVLNAVTHNEFKTHIKINLSDKKVEAVSCGCSDFKELSKTRKLFMCQHLTGTGYKFLNQLYKKKENQKELPKKEIEKDKVAVGIKVTHKLWKGVTTYELEFRLGFEHKYLIDDLRSFISALDKEKKIYFNNQFAYNPVNHEIRLSDMKIIDFIREKVHTNKNISSTGRNLIIDPKELRKFLSCILEDKIIFKYKGIEYKTFVFKEDLPLSFTLKEKDDHLILTTHKKLPIILNENRDVYLFNDELYLPSENQIRKYNLLYEGFQKNGRVQFVKTIQNYNKLISLLNSISKNVTISEEVKRFSSNSLSFEFHIYKEEECIYCDVYATYYNEKINILDENSSKMQLIRDFSREEKVLMKLEYYRFIRRENKLLFVGGDEELFNLLNNRENIIHSLGSVTFGKGLENIKIYDSRSIEIDLYEENGYLNFNYNIGDIDVGELNNIIESYKADNRFYKTKDNGFLDFEDEGVITFLNLIQVLNEDTSIEDKWIQIEKNKVLYITEALKNRDYKLGEGVHLLKDIENKLTELNSKELLLPRDLKAKLREYQVGGFKWFKSLSEVGFGGILADEMGLGKTVQTIAFLLSEEDKKSLIITPTSLIYNWKDEFKKFSPTLRIGVAHGSSSEHEKIISNLEDYDVILTTYGTLRNNIKKYNEISFDYCIIDEAQNIKNSEAQTTKIVKEVKAKTRFALTGTPMENNLMELWSIFDFVMPGYLYSKENFYKKFIYDTEFDLENLKLLIKPFILRRTKKEVIEELPDKIEKKMTVQMTTAQRAVYSSYIKDVRAKMKNNFQGKIEVFSYLTKLRQICLDPSIILEEYKGGSGKVRAAMTLLEENIHSGGKTLLFSQFTSALKKIGESLEDRKIEYFYLDGSTPSKERIRLVNEFNNSEEVKVFLISLKAGGTGLNLTSANLVIHFDPWWNPAVENQATDRAHRIGQRNVVEVVKLVAKGTIEEKILTLQEHKKELIDNIITGELKDSSMINRLSREELVQLFNRD
ncbi:DEAD/DEAH box helicase [Clostridium sp. A1-XYC3]|uniref:DEAD/DEAH box helicase n=1 Tax=Clostridium tanneri TaxID=3037988 RepID=A0ABU4JRN6_9CLOT|nr:DEAD/DEAH box helicase [Clostridium sp. A1-XYC3]MDW8800790.1 DEAD/DEAH box helicase [Clostridium sp. A1-XYC3]